MTLDLKSTASVPHDGYILSCLRGFYELRENNQILELRENNQVLVVLTKLAFWLFGLENGLEGQF